MNIPIPMICFLALACGAMVVLLIISELQIRSMNRTFWLMADNARQSQETAIRAIAERDGIRQEYEQMKRGYDYLMQDVPTEELDAEIEAGNE